MADIQMTGSVPEAETSGNFASAANWLGAAMSLALIVGVTVWGYRLIVRDVSGVPVVRAIEGPMRVAPDNPGGQIARHSGLAVNDVAGTGASTPPPDQLTLAPRPLDVTEEDAPVAQLAPQLETLTEREELALASLQQDTSEDEAAVVLSEIQNADDPIQALADQIAANATPFTDLDPAPETGVFETQPSEDTEDVAGLVDAPAIVPPSVPGVSRSLRPAPRPAGLQTVSLAAPAAQSARGPELDPADIPAGTRLVQFGAYDSPQIAREQWGRLEARFDDFLSGKNRVIEEAKSGGRVFYRLRAEGFSDLSDSRRFCAALVAEGADCIPVVSR